MATQGIPVATRTRLLNTIYVTTLSKYVATQSKSKPKKISRGRIQEATIEAATKTESSVVTNLSMSRQIDQFGQEFW